MTLRTPSPRGDGGSSLVEVLIAIAIMAITFGAILGGLGTAVVGSDVHRSKALADTHLKSYAEQVKTAVDYTACASAADYTLPAGSFSAPGYVVRPTRVEVWNNDNPASFQPVGAGCVDKGLQRITLTLTVDSGRLGPQSTQIVKRAG